MRSLLVVLATLSVVSPVAAQPGPDRGPDRTIDAATRRQVIEGSLAALTKDYVYPEVATKIAVEIHQHAAAKKYDAVTSARAFAAALTTDLQAVSHDKHMRVMFSSEPLRISSRTGRRRPRRSSGSTIR